MLVVFVGLVCLLTGCVIGRYWERKRWTRWTWNMLDAMIKEHRNQIEQCERAARCDGDQPVQVIVMHGMSNKKTKRRMN